ncbi:MAG: hypothetical protein M5U01_11360 [Ardenticatenaceae bacterium]|nr:hypothetical protein [Ardenticatenaceae bacterium]
MRIPTKTSSSVMRLMVLCTVFGLFGVSSAWASAAHLDRTERRPAQTDPGAGTIDGTVFNDLNLNQVRDTGEPGVAGATIELYDAGGALVGSRSSDSNGFFEFATVPAGNNYRLRLVNSVGFATTSGDERVVTVLTDTSIQVAFALYQPGAAATTPTSESGPRETPTLGPTFTATPTSTPTLTPVPTDTPIPTNTSGPTETLPPSTTPTPPTATPSPTPSTTPTVTPTGTFFPLTPIATYITTTPGVRVTVTPAATPARTAGELPRTGSGMPLLWALGFGAIMIGAGLARRLFFRNR